MNFVLEVFTSVLLDIAMLLMVLNLVHKNAHGTAAERFTAVSMGLGFLTYCISKAINGGSYTVLTLAALGFMLSYMAFVFTFSRE